MVSRQPCIKAAAFPFQSPALTDWPRQLVLNVPALTGAVKCRRGDPDRLRHMLRAVGFHSLAPLAAARAASPGLTILTSSGGALMGSPLSAIVSAMRTSASRE